MLGSRTWSGEDVLDPRFVFLGALFSLVGSVCYATQTVRGHTQPNRVTWFLWTAAPLIGVAAQLSDGVGLPAVLTLSIGVGPAIVFASSFVNPAAYWRISRFDVACGGVSVAAIVLWQTLGSATLGVVFAVLADLVAGVPTVRKAWRSPETEHPSVFRNSAINGIITLLTIDRWTVSTWAFPVYITFIGIGLWSIIRFPGMRPRRPVALPA